MSEADSLPVPDGLAVIDKQAGRTSHDVVAELRAVLGIRKVGHAGTLDPMATGVLVCGVGQATRLLGHLSLSDKEYLATIRLGAGTDTDDKEGSVISRGSATHVGPAEIEDGLARLRGEVLQRPSSVSAIKVAGERAYRRVRAGESVELAARPVRVDRLEMLACREAPGSMLDVDVAVECSSGTYVRAIARDLGEALGTGGHLVALRRIRVGPFGIDSATPARSPEILGLGAVCDSMFARLEVSDPQADDLRHGRSVRTEPGADEPRCGDAGAPTVAAFDPAGRVVALLVRRGDAWGPKLVFRLVDPGGGL